MTTPPKPVCTARLLGRATPYSRDVRLPIAPFSLLTFNFQLSTFNFQRPRP